MHKWAVVKSLMDQAKKISTTKSDWIKEKQWVISTLQSNGYPKHFILDASKPKPWHQSGIQTPSDNKPEETRDPVYDSPCADCSKSYSGEMQRKFLTRKGEHQKAVARRQGEKSALADHEIKTYHDIA